MYIKIKRRGFYNEKCFLWGIGKIFVQNVNTVKYHEMCKNFEVVGITSNTDIYSEIYG